MRQRAAGSPVTCRRVGSGPLVRGATGMYVVMAGRAGASLRTCFESGIPPQRGRVSVTRQFVLHAATTPPVMTERDHLGPRSTECANFYASPHGRRQEISDQSGGSGTGRDPGPGAGDGSASGRGSGSQGPGTDGDCGSCGTGSGWLGTGPGPSGEGFVVIALVLALCATELLDERWEGAFRQARPACDQGYPRWHSGVA